MKAKHLVFLSAVAFSVTSCGPQKGDERFVSARDACLANLKQIEETKQSWTDKNRANCEVAAADSGAPVAPRPIDVAIDRLIRHPATYHGRLVRVTGFVRLEFEGNGIFLREDDLKQRENANALWLDIRKADFLQKKREFDGKYVRVEATFNAHDKGHMGAWPGCLENPSKLEHWNPN